MPERQLKELESGLQPPISDSMEIGTERVEFRYKRINKVV